MIGLGINPQAMHAETVDGADPLAVLEKSASVLARPEEQMPHLFKLRGGGEVPAALEIQMADGRIITQQCHPVEDAYGGAVGHIWIFEDVTRARQTADQLVYQVVGLGRGVCAGDPQQYQKARADPAYHRSVHRHAGARDALDDNPHKIKGR